MKKEKMNVLHIAVFAAVCLVASALSAQEADTSKSHKLREVVVSATRSEMDPDSVGRSITLISNEQIKNSGANSLAEILSQQEGIYIVGTGQTPGQIQNVFMRGANSNQTAILVDGIRLTDPSATDNAIELSELSLSNIERIEIVRGSHSTLYGSSAIGGVINIITKKGMTPGVHVDADMRAGVFGPGTSEFIENVFANFTSKSGFYGSAEVYNNKTNGLDAVVDTVTNPNNYGHNHRDRDGFTKTDLIGKVGYRTEKLDLFASCKRVDQKADIDAGAFQDDPAYTAAFSRNLYTWGAGYKFSPEFNILYAGGLTNLIRTDIDDSSVVDNAGTYNHSYYKGVYKGATMTHDLQASWKSKGITLVAGGNFFNETMTANTFSLYTGPGSYKSESSLDSLHINVNTVSEFIHVDLDGSLINQKCKIFALGLGARNTHHDLFGNNTSWEVNPSLRLANNGLLFCSVSTGFNAPSLNQLYDPAQDPGSHITRGNPTLLPEISNSIEVGFKQKVNEHLGFHVSYFKTVVKNSIDYVYLWNKNRPVDSLTYLDYKGDTYVNIGTQTNQGFEISVNSKISEKLTMGANVSLINGRLDYDPSLINNFHIQGNQVQLFANGAFINKQVESFNLVRRPSAANISFSWKPCSRLMCRADVRYVGPRNDIYYNSSLGPYGALSTQGMGDYVLVDLNFRYRIMKGLTAGLKVENLFDEKYYEIYGYTTRGRSFYLSLRYAF